MSMSEYQNIKTFLQKVTLQIRRKRFWGLKELKILLHRHVLLVILMVKKLLESFTKKNCRRQSNRV